MMILSPGIKKMRVNMEDGVDYEAWDRLTEIMRKNDPTEEQIKVMKQVTEILEHNNLNVYDLLAKKLVMREGEANRWYDMYNNTFILTQYGFERHD